MEQWMNWWLISSNIEDNYTYLLAMHSYSSKTKPNKFTKKNLLNMFNIAEWQTIYEDLHYENWGIIVGEK